MRKLIASKLDLLRLAAKRQVITTNDLMHVFLYPYDSARQALYRMGRAGLLENELSPDEKTKNWSLTQRGLKHLIYLIDKEEKENG